MTKNIFFKKDRNNLNLILPTFFAVCKHCKDLIDLIYVQCKLEAYIWALRKCFGGFKLTFDDFF